MLLCHPLPHWIGINCNNSACFPYGTSGKENACQCSRRKRHGFSPWVGNIPWRRVWQPTPVFLPWESHGQRSLVGYSSWGCEESDTAKHTEQQAIIKERVDHSQSGKSAAMAWGYLSTTMGKSMWVRTTSHPYQEPTLEWFFLQCIPQSHQRTDPPTLANSSLQAHERSPSQNHSAKPLPNFWPVRYSKHLL